MVSIIIPHFNRSLLLKETIDSIKNQTYPDWEIIVVDDGSDEAEWKKLKSYEEEGIKIFQRTDGQKGPSRSRNIGVSKCSGKYLIFLDTDDLLASFCLEQRVISIKANPEMDACVFLMQEFEQKPGDNDGVYNLEIEEVKWIDSFIKNENPWNVTCPIWKKEAFIRTGGFDESFLYMEDPEIHLRALQSGLRFKTMYHLPADCFYRVHHFDETKSSFYYNSILYRIKFYRKLTSGFYPCSFVQQYKKEIKKGTSILIKTFLYSRRSQFNDLYNELMTWMKSSGLFSFVEILRYRLLLNAGNTEITFLKRLKIKGMCYKLLPA